MPKLSEVMHIGKNAKGEVEYFAERVWRQYFRFATVEADTPTETYTTNDGVQHKGYRLEIYNRQVWEVIFPGATFDHFPTLPVMEALKKSGNVVCTQKNDRMPSVWFVREHWRKFSEMGPPRNPSAKVSSPETVETTTATKPKGTQRMSEFVIPQENGTFKCFTCPYTDKSFQSVLMHVNRTGNKPHAQEEIPCYFRCGQIANDPHSAATHLNKWHTADMKAHNLATCHQCQYVSNPKDVRAHAAKEHAKPRKRKAVAKPIPEVEPEMPKLEKLMAEAATFEVDLNEFATAIGQLVAEEMAKVKTQYEAKLTQVSLERDSLQRRVDLMRAQFENFRKGLDVFTQE